MSATGRVGPERLNLAIARRCFVACRGCYQFFGRSEPELGVIEASVARFVQLGVTAVTISGGDPLTVPGLAAFLVRLRAVGVTSIKVDTVGTSMLDPVGAASAFGAPHQPVQDLLALVDFLGLPLDGWSDQSTRLFRTGRAGLYTETVALLDAIDRCSKSRPVVINTVVHRHNLGGLCSILEEVRRHRSIAHWNLFQYTPTDQVADRVNSQLSLEESAFAHACADLLEGAPPREHGGFTIEARSVRSRLGQYLLINSDGECWLPDEHGRSVRLGVVHGREEAVLAAWADTAFRIRTKGQLSLGRPEPGIPRVPSPAEAA